MRLRENPRRGEFREDGVPASGIAAFSVGRIDGRIIFGDAAEDRFAVGRRHQAANAPFADDQQRPVTVRPPPQDVAKPFQPFAESVGLRIGIIQLLWTKRTFLPSER